MHDLANILVLDTETSGLDPSIHSLLSVGLVAGDGRLETEFYVAEPTIVADPRAMAVNRLDLDRVRSEGLSPAAACDAIDRFIDEMKVDRPVIIAGHNIAFDIAFLRRLYRLADRPMRSLSHRSIDTHSLMWALAARGKLPAHVQNSDTAFAHFGIEPPEALRHTALGDAVATRLLVERLLELVG